MVKFTAHMEGFGEMEILYFLDYSNYEILGFSYFIFHIVRYQHPWGQKANSDLCFYAWTYGGAYGTTL